jgi:transaldolase/glucose-6-phosphate isomerase
VASVASFFVSRIDTAADDLLEKIAARADSDALRQRAEALRGQVAIANAKLAYRDWQALVATDRWRRLATAGAQPQRLLWASTSSKNPRYRDVVYVESLIGPETVDTVPPATFDAFREHGRVEATLERDVPGAQRTLDELAGLGISIDEITDRLLVEGVRLFAEPFAKLLANIEGRRPAERALQA